MDTLHTDASIDAYFVRWESGYVDYLEDMTSRPAYKWFLNGRNIPKVKAGMCEPEDERRQTWSPTWYGAMAASDDIAERWGSDKLIKWHDENLAAAIRLVPRWISVFGIPPGEDCLIPGLCGVSWDFLMKDVRKNRGDTDPKRHIDFYCHLRRLARPEVRQRLTLLGINESMIADFVGSIKNWVAGTIQHAATNPREYLRIGNIISTAAGLVIYADAIGDTDLRFQAVYAIRWFLFAYFPMEDRQTIQGADGTWWHDYNYGDMELVNGKWQPPFPYGWYPKGMQVWYRGHVTTALTRVAAIAVQFGMVDVLDKVLEVFMIQTRWCDGTERTGAPFADYNASGSLKFYNSCVGGGKATPDANERFMMAGDPNNWQQELAGVNVGDMFLRFAFSCSGVGVWTMDPTGYHDLVYRDPGGGAHQRLHDSGSGRKFTPRLPGFETSNGYECVDGQGWRAAVMNSAERKTYTRFLAFHHIGWPHISNPVIKLGTELEGPIEGAALVGKPGRPTAWVTECASDVRSASVGVQPGGNNTYPNILQSLWDADTTNAVKHAEALAADADTPPVEFSLDPVS